jgi:putative transposase
MRCWKVWDFWNPAVISYMIATKFSESFRDTLAAGGVRPVKLRACSPNLNALAERWVRSIKEECLSKLVLIGESSLRRSMAEHL